MGKRVLGIIGGSGFYQMDGLDRPEPIELDTPFGKPSDSYYRSRLGDTELIFLARHGRGHRLMPSEINYCANLFGMKQLGVEYLVSVSSAGSMRESIAPGDFVVPDQFYDHTFKRPATFFGRGVVVHVSLADPVCSDLRRDLATAGRKVGAKTHDRGTYFCIEGPQFSTRAESNIYRSWGIDVISMTAMQEARLAREAEFCYAALALVTDYDCWHESAQQVVIADVLRVLKDNVALAQKTVVELAAALARRDRTCQCGSSLREAIITDRALIPSKLASELAPLVGKYL
jgi:5'-methylthioadenosine phosphorylase